MTDFIVNNYILIISITAFLIFALIGFAVDSSKNRKNKEDEILTEHEEVVIENEENLENNNIVETNLENTIDIQEENNNIQETQTNSEEEFAIPEIEDNK